jgi:hypothetical protein
MKKLIILFVFFAAYLFPQSWNTVVQTTIPLDNLVGLDLCSNKDGNHILVNNHIYSGGVHTYDLKYHLLNSSGSVIRSYTFETIQGGNGIEFASIDGSNERIYVVYKLWNSNLIKTRKSTNAGVSWSTNIQTINIGNNACNNIDIIFGKDDNALHVVWATQDAGNDYETYYRRLPSTDQWDVQKTVTDYGNEVGGLPTVSKSQDRVHVSYNNSSTAKTRDKLNSTWQTPQLIFDDSFGERVHAGSSKLFDFYYKHESGMGFFYTDLYVKARSFSSSSWSSPVLITSFANAYDLISAANTYDGKTHIVYEISDAVGYRSYNGTSWSSETSIGSGYLHPRIHSVSNDFLLFGEKTGHHRINSFTTANTMLHH